MKILIDLIVIVILGYFIVKGYKNGFVISLVDSCSCIFSFIATFCTYNHVVPFVTSSPVGKFISENIEKIIMGIFKDKTDAIIGELKLPSFLVSGISKSSVIYDAAQSLSTNITGTLIALVTIVVLYFLIKLLLKLLKKPIKTLASLPVIKQINTLLGVITGLVAGCFWIYVIMASVSLLSFVPLISTITEFIEGTTIAKIFFDGNIILSILK